MATKTIATRTGSKRLWGYGHSAEDAEADLADKLHRLTAPPPPPVDGITLGDYWAVHYAPTVVSRSVHWRRQIAWTMRHCKPLLDTPLASITRADVQHLIGSLPLSPLSVAHVRRVLGSVLSLAHDDELINRNPVNRVTVPRRVAGPAPVVRLEDWPKLLAATDPTARPSVVLALTCGLRAGELARAAWRDVQPTRLVVHGTKTAASIRTIPLTSLHHQLLGVRGRAADHPGLHVKTLRLRLNEAFKLAEVRRVHLHGLRHSYATALQMLGCPEEYRARLLGHGKRGVTAIYSHGEWAEMVRWQQALMTALEQTSTFSALSDCCQPGKSEKA